MQAIWFKGCVSSEDKEKRKQEILRHARAYEELTELLQSEFKDLPAPDFSQAGWAGSVAYDLGGRQMLKRILNIINLKE